MFEDNDDPIAAFAELEAEEPTALPSEAILATLFNSPFIIGIDNRKYVQSLRVFEYPPNMRNALVQLFEILGIHHYKILLAYWSTL